MWDKSPCNCRTMMDQNVILTVFHAWSQICCVQKMFKTTFPGIIVLQLQEESCLVRTYTYVRTYVRTYVHIYHCCTLHTLGTVHCTPSAQCSVVKEANAAPISSSPVPNQSRAAGHQLQTSVPYNNSIKTRAAIIHNVSQILSKQGNNYGHNCTVLYCTDRINICVLTLFHGILTLFQANNYRHLLSPDQEIFVRSSVC